ncbi:hypothetical protein B7494_g5223 [Chlorociboria aeruginascens]|nr:hypothetical protein B7494_g5223 [Chlorociboria aeruginascens]
MDKDPSTSIATTTTSIEDSEVVTAHEKLYERKVLRKVDIWLVGFYSLVYIFRVIDSSNYSNAAIINLEQGTNIKKQLHLNPSQWAWTLSIFSYSYLIFEPTNTLLLKRFRPSRWMFVLILGWGICACSVAAVQDFQGMMVVRFAIGMAEAGFYPAVLYHMSFWYKATEMPWRIALFYSVGQLASALSGLLAFAIGFLNGVGNLAGWRWLFLLEGLPAIVLSVVALFGLPDYPQTARMLRAEERLFILKRLSSTAPSGADGHWDFVTLKVLFSDPTNYTFAVYWIAHGIGGFGITYALPTVIYQLGFTTTSLSQLMNITMIVESTTIICYIILVTVPSAVVKYLALIVAVSCAGSAYPVIWPERIRALDGTVAAGVGIGFTNAMAQFGGIVGPHVDRFSHGLLKTSTADEASAAFPQSADASDAIRLLKKVELDEQKHWAHSGLAIHPLAGTPPFVTCVTGSLVHTLYDRAVSGNQVDVDAVGWVHFGAIGRHADMSDFQCWPIMLDEHRDNNILQFPGGGDLDERVASDTMIVLQKMADIGSSLSQLNSHGVYHFLTATGHDHGDYPGIWCSLWHPDYRDTRGKHFQTEVQVKFYEGYQIYDPRNEVHQKSNLAASLSRRKRNMANHCAFFDFYRFGAIIGYYTETDVGLVIVNFKAVDTFVTKDSDAHYAITRRHLHLFCSIHMYRSTVCLQGGMASHDDNWRDMFCWNDGLLLLQPPPSHEDYRPNLGNTVAVVLLTIPLFTVLYVTLWYPGLRDNVLIETSDSVTNVRFPSIAIFQREDWTSQASLLGTDSAGVDSKCFLGWYDDSAPSCESLGKGNLGNTTRCNCEELWYNNGSVIEGFEWMNAVYRYTVFDAPAWLSSDTPTYLLTLQTFFTYNMTLALSDSSSQNPTLFIAAYDSELGLQNSFDRGYTRMTLVNANGVVALNTGLRLRRSFDGLSAYDYELGVSSAPARDMVCDTTSAMTYQYPCHLSLFIQIPNFQRTIFTQEKSSSRRGKSFTGITSTCTKSSDSTLLPNYEVTIGQYNDVTLDAIDAVLFQFCAAGIKAIISPHDANLLPPNGTTVGYNGIDIYGTTYGTSYNFYTNATAAEQYDARLASILNYKSPRFHKRWADLDEVILAFDLQNEPIIASPDLLTGNDPTNWLCSRASALKSIPHSSKILVATGGVGGSQYSGHEYNLLAKALACPAIDIMSVHGYMTLASQWAFFFPALRDQAVAAGKLIMVEEWGVSTQSGSESVEVQAEVFEESGVPWLYWMTILGKSVDQNCTTADGACCHVGLSASPYDYEISLTSPRANWTDLYHNASATIAAQDWGTYIS